MKHSLESLPRRIFLDSCTAQTLRNHGGYINADEPIDASDRIHRVTDGIANIEALRNIFLVNECALFEWIVSSEPLTSLAFYPREPNKISRKPMVCVF
jgi:hypothetical protein